MSIDLNDPAMEGYQPLEDFIVNSDDRSSRIRDIPADRARYKLGIYPSQVTFNDQAVDSISPALTIILINRGYNSIVINDIQVVGDFELAPTTVTELAVGDIKELQVTFKPTKIGTVTGGIYVNTGDAGGNEFIKLTGTGI